MESKPMCLWCKETIYVSFTGYCLDCQNQLDKNNINMNELPKEELNLIAQIDARLNKLEQFMADVIGTPIAPIEQVEQPKEEAKERYGVFTGKNDNGFEVLVLGIETESQANELKEKIKALLQTL